MANEWILYGVRRDDPYRIKTSDELIQYVNEIGFLPLFKNEIPGFSVEERTVPYDWWSGSEKRDPWEWRRIIAGSKELAYGKFFNQRAGFISLEWFPVFANYRRNGYDFDSRWDDELATTRQKKIMDCYADKEEYFSYELKHAAGFGKDGEKNFEGVVTALEMQTYLTIRDFRQRINKARRPYGWHIAIYSTPEHIWGEDLIASGYNEDPEESGKRILEHIKEIYPIATEEQIKTVIL